MDIRLEEVRVERGGRCVLDIPSLQFVSGRTTAVVGANGAGKTTLLRAIAGLERPRLGRILVGGLPTNPRLRRVSYVFQEDVFVGRTVLANLELGLRMDDVSPKEVRARAVDALQMLGVEHLTNRRADRLSGGEARRVSLARALCLRRPVLLLDEPLAGLDRVTYGRLLNDLPPLLERMRATTLVVTHDRDDALRLSDHLVVLADGRVGDAGDKNSVVTNPRSIEVAKALGYAVLVCGNRHVAVPPAMLRLGPGPTEFVMHVDAVVDVVGHYEVLGRIGEEPVRIRLERNDQRGHPGEQIRVHAECRYDVD